MSDLRYAVRTLMKSPGFTLVAVLTLALGIGANTAIFSAVDSVLLHPLPFEHPEQLVQVTKTMPMFGLFQSQASALDFLEYRALSKSFSDMAAVQRGNLNLTGDQRPERVPAMTVSTNLFPMLGARPFLGRAFLTEEGRWGRHHAVILGEALWKRRFGSDPRILGSRIQIEGEAYTVVGVVRPMLEFVLPAELWLPLAFSPQDVAPDQRGHQNIEVLARSNPGVTPPQIQADLQGVADQMTQRLPDWYPKGWTIDAQPLAAAVAGPVRTPLLILLGAVALVLLVGCANVANLLLARANVRRKEISIRAALGASRMRLVGQLLIENGLLSVAAGLAGMFIAVTAIDLFSRFGPAGLLRGQHPQINLFVAAFTAALSLGTVFLFGLIPAISASRVDLNDALNEATRGTGSLQKRRLREILVGAELALSLVLLISAGLLIRSFVRLAEASPGFAADHVLTAQLSLPVVGFRSPASVSQFYGQLSARLASLPGVAGAGVINNLPLSGSNRGGSFGVIGHRRAPNEAVPDVDQRSATPGYFEAMCIPVLRGRVFTDQDGFNAPKVAVVDQPFVREFFPKESPLGKQLTGPGSGAYTIVGVVGGIKHRSLASPPVPTIYYPQLQAPINAMAIVLRTSGVDPLNLASAVRKEIAAMNPDLPVFRVFTMEQVMAISVARTRFSTTLLGVLALLALLLAAIGIYGMVSYAVGQRTREIGIRIALGARSSDAVSLILRQGMVPILAGIVAGLTASLAATRTLSTQLYGTSTTDPLTFVAVSAFLALVALVAGYLPARRATKVDPMVALRYE